MSNSGNASSISNAKVQSILNLAEAAAGSTGDRVDFARQLLLLLRRWEGESVPLIEDQQVWGPWRQIIKQCLAERRWRDALEYPAVALDQNYNLMAAEHYAFARYIARLYGDPNTDATLNTYFPAKKILIAVGGEKLLRTSANHPVLRESTASLAWKSKGVIDGLDDYRKANGGKPGIRNSSRSMVMPNAIQQYKLVGAKAVPAYAQGS